MNGYEELIRKGLASARSFGRKPASCRGSREENVERLKRELQTADAVVVGAGAGLSTAAGLTYGGERFAYWFPDFAARFGVRDMYSGGFYPYPDAETRWAWWARNIYCNRYVDPPKPTFRTLLSLLEGKEYFVITTNVDHQFQRAGFDKCRLFYTQGDYGLFQSTDPKNRKTYDNEGWVMRAMEAQGFVRGEDGVFRVPENGRLKMWVPPDLIPVCPDDGSPVTTNLRVDDSFVEDEGWHRASSACWEFIEAHAGRHVLYLEIGVGANTPVIIKYPFWALTAEEPNAVYACLNHGEAFCPKPIEDRSICLDGDADELLSLLAER